MAESSFRGLIMQKCLNHWIKISLVIQTEEWHAEIEPGVHDFFLHILSADYKEREGKHSSWIHKKAVNKTTSVFSSSRSDLELRFQTQSCFVLRWTVKYAVWRKLNFVHSLRQDIKEVFTPWDYSFHSSICKLYGVHTERQTSLFWHPRPLLPGSIVFYTVGD